MQEIDCVTIVSGGLDSTVLMHVVREAGWTQACLSFDYGQRHRKELEYARSNARYLGLSWDLIDLTSITAHLDSALTTKDAEIPHGHYAAENMRATVVPNRNAIMLTIAAGIANSRGGSLVSLGVHAGDHPVYPDCRPGFVNDFVTMQSSALDGINAPFKGVFAPFIHQTKAMIVETGTRLGVHMGATWSCYEGGTVHCGQCGTCVERYEAFKVAKVPDPTVYLNDPRAHLVPA